MKLWPQKQPCCKPAMPSLGLSKWSQGQPAPARAKLQVGRDSTIRTQPNPVAGWVERAQASQSSPAALRRAHHWVSSVPSVKGLKIIFSVASLSLEGQNMDSHRETRLGCDSPSRRGDRHASRFTPWMRDKALYSVWTTRILLSDFPGAWL